METWLNGLSYKDDEEEMRAYKKKLKMLANTIDNLLWNTNGSRTVEVTEQRKRQEWNKRDTNKLRKYNSYNVTNGNNYNS